MDNRWLHVWEDEQEAQAFCEEFRAETHDAKWHVEDLPASADASVGPLMPVVIYVTRQSLGSTFAIHPHSRTAIRRRFRDARPVSNIYVEYITQSDFEATHGPIWDHIAMVLTGLSAEQLAELGGYQVIDPRTERIVYDPSAAAAL
jgi:hypothetical protein